MTGVLAKPFDTILGGEVRRAAVEKADAKTQAAIQVARRQHQAVPLEAENESRPQGILVGADSPTTPYEVVGWSQNNMVGDTGLEPVTSALSIRLAGQPKCLEMARNHRLSREKLVPVADRAEPQKPASIRWMEDARRTRHRYVRLADLDVHGLDSAVELLLRTIYFLQRSIEL